MCDILPAADDPLLRRIKIGLAEVREEIVGTAVSRLWMLRSDRVDQPCLTKAGDCRVWSRLPFSDDVLPPCTRRVCNVSQHRPVSAWMVGRLHKADTLRTSIAMV